MITLKFRHGAMGMALGAALLAAMPTPSRAAEPMLLAPAPATDAAPGDGSAQTVVLSGGCFWGVQGVYEHVKGVTKALSGYAGGNASTAHYETVSTGTTGHAESVKITFDPKQVSFGTILRIYFSVATNPTELNFQGPDDGTQYRGEIWTMNDDQARVAKAYIAQLDAAHVFKQPIVTRVDPYMGFYPAEDYHQDFLVHNPTYGYIAYNDMPKVEGLQQYFPALYSATPVLALPGKNS
jgi:peptide-methionine (S)-S-oxide reductase